jgi:hypothetical protein
MNGTGMFFAEAKRPERGVDHPPSSKKVKVHLPRPRRPREVAQI